MTNGRRTRVVLLALGMLGPSLAGAQCVLAPRHGAFCRYTDPALFQTLVATGMTEAARWGAMDLEMPAVRTTTASVGRSADTIAAYDSVLRTLKTPTAPVPLIFAATFNLQHPSARVHMVNRDGSTQLVPVDSLAYVQANAVLRPATGDPVQTLATQVALGGRNLGTTSAGIGSELGAIYRQNDSAQYADTMFGVAARGIAGRARATSTGMQGQSEGQILTAQARLEAVRAGSETGRLEANAATIAGFRRAQLARAQQTDALRTWADRHLTQGGWQ